MTSALPPGLSTKADRTGASPRTWPPMVTLMCSGSLSRFTVMIVSVWRSSTSTYCFPESKKVGSLSGWGGDEGGHAHAQSAVSYCLVIAVIIDRNKKKKKKKKLYVRGT